MKGKEFDAFEQEKKELEEKARLNLALIRMKLKGPAIQKASKTGTRTVAIGGALFLLYIAGRKIFKKKKVASYELSPQDQLIIKDPKRDSFIVRKIKEHMAVFLLGIVKAKLNNYLRASENRNEVVRKTD